MSKPGAQNACSDERKDGESHNLTKRAIDSVKRRLVLDLLCFKFLFQSQYSLSGSTAATFRQFAGYV